MEEVLKSENKVKKKEEIKRPWQGNFFIFEILLGWCLLPLLLIISELKLGIFSLDFENNLFYFSLVCIPFCLNLVVPVITYLTFYFFNYLCFFFSLFSLIIFLFLNIILIKSILRGNSKKIILFFSLSFILGILLLIITSPYIYNNRAIDLNGKTYYFIFIYLLNFFISISCLKHPFYNQKKTK